LMFVGFLYVISAMSLKYASQVFYNLKLHS
jgi:hypothetical protein